MVVGAVPSKILSDTCMKVHLKLYILMVHKAVLYVVCKHREKKGEKHIYPIYCEKTCLKGPVVVVVALCP